MAKPPNDPVLIGMTVFDSERSLWDQATPLAEHLVMCNEASVRIAVLAERKRCVDTLDEMWTDFFESTEDMDKPYMRAYKDALEDATEGLMAIDPQEGADLDSVMAAVADEKRMRQQERKRMRVVDVAVVQDDHPEKPEPDVLEMMQSGEAERAMSTEEIEDPRAIEGADKLDDLVRRDADDTLGPGDFRSSDYDDIAD